MAGVKYVGKVKGLVKVTTDMVEAYAVCPYIANFEHCCEHVSEKLWINPHQSTLICSCAKCVDDFSFRCIGNGETRFDGRMVLVSQELRDVLVRDIVEGGE